MRIKLLASTAALVLLSGCATTQNAAPGSQGYKTGSYTTVNHQRVQRVERLARIQGTDVHWVNPPRTVHRKDG